jgi:hypothetical protein
MAPAMDTDGLRSAADVLDRLASMGDASPADAAILAAEVREMLAGLASALTRARETSAAALYQTGLSARELGEVLGVSRQRAHLLASAGMRATWGETATGRADAGSDPRAEYDAYLEASYQAAETACNGQLVRAQDRATVDPKSFWWRRGPLRVSAVSEELARYWGLGEHFRSAGEPTGPRVPLTFTAWQAQQRETEPAAHT